MLNESCRCKDLEGAQVLGMILMLRNPRQTTRQYILPSIIPSPYDLVAKIKGSGSNTARFGSWP